MGIDLAVSGGVNPFGSGTGGPYLKWCHNRISIVPHWTGITFRRIDTIAQQRSIFGISVHKLTELLLRVTGNEQENINSRTVLIKP